LVSEFYNFDPNINTDYLQRLDTIKL
jgi:hypothetical protein